MKRHMRGLYPWLLAFPAMTSSLEQIIIIRLQIDRPVVVCCSVFNVIDPSAFGAWHLLQEQWFEIFSHTKFWYHCGWPKIYSCIDWQVSINLHLAWRACTWLNLECFSFSDLLLRISPKKLCIGQGIEFVCTFVTVQVLLEYSCLACHCPGMISGLGTARYL